MYLLLSSAGQTNVNHVSLLFVFLYVGSPIYNIPPLTRVTLASFLQHLSAGTILFTNVDSFHFSLLELLPLFFCFHIFLAVWLVHTAINTTLYCPCFFALAIKNF